MGTSESWGDNNKIARKIKTNSQTINERSLYGIKTLRL